MTPQLEKKQMKMIGQPRLSFQDISAAAAASSAGKFPSSLSSTYPLVSNPAASAVLGGPIDVDATASITLENAMKPRGGYLMPMHMDKYKVHHDECTGQITMAPLLFGLGNAAEGDGSTFSVPSARLTMLDTMINPITHRDSPDWEATMHSRKFDRHMRSTRRNHRRNPNNIPVLSMLG